MRYEEQQAPVRCGPPIQWPIPTCPVTSVGQSSRHTVHVPPKEYAVSKVGMHVLVCRGLCAVRQCVVRGDGSEFGFNDDTGNDLAVRTFVGDQQVGLVLVRVDIGRRAIGRVRKHLVRVRQLTMACDNGRCSELCGDRGKTVRRQRTTTRHERSARIVACLPMPRLNHCKKSSRSSAR